MKSGNLLQVVLQVICGRPKQPALLARWTFAHLLAVAQAPHRLPVTAAHDGREEARVLAYNAAALVVVRERLLVNIRTVARHAHAIRDAFFLNFFAQRKLLSVHAAEFISQHLEVVRAEIALPSPVL